MSSAQNWEPVMSGSRAPPPRHESLERHRRAAGNKPGTWRSRGRAPSPPADRRRRGRGVLDVEAVHARPCRRPPEVASRARPGPAGCRWPASAAAAERPIEGVAGAAPDRRRRRRRLGEEALDQVPRVGRRSPRPHAPPLCESTPKSTPRHRRSAHAWRPRGSRRVGAPRPAARTLYSRPCRRRQPPDPPAAAHDRSVSAISAWT